MSHVQLTRVINRWNPTIGTPLIHNWNSIITKMLNKFEKIRQNCIVVVIPKNFPRNNPEHDRIFESVQQWNP